MVTSREHHGVCADEPVSSGQTAYSGGSGTRRFRTGKLGAGDTFSYGTAISARGLVRPPRPRRLADIAPTVRQLFGLSARPASAQAGAVLAELRLEAEN